MSEPQWAPRSPEPQLQPSAEGRSRPARPREVPWAPSHARRQGAGGWADRLAHMTAGTRRWAETKFGKKNKARKTDKRGGKRDDKARAAETTGVSCSESARGPTKRGHSAERDRHTTPTADTETQRLECPRAAGARASVEPWGPAPQWGSDAHSGRSWSHPIRGLPAVCLLPRLGT